MKAIQAKKSVVQFNADELATRAIHRRAFEAVIWGMPAVNFDLMLQAMKGSAKGKPNQIVYWSRLPDWKNQTLTPNPDSIYLMPFFDTKDVGPVVLEIPPADKGTIVGSSEHVVVDVTFNLDGQLVFGAIEIQNIRPYRVLPSKLCTDGGVLQTFPEMLLSGSCLMTKLLPERFLFPQVVDLFHGN